MPQPKEKFFIDLDPQGNASTAAGIEGANRKTLCDHYFDQVSLEDCTQNSTDDYKIIPGDENLIALDVAIRNDNKQGFLIKEVKKILKTNLTIQL